MNISKTQQRTLHALAQGGCITVEKDARGKIVAVSCITRDGWALADCTTGVFRTLRRRRWIISNESAPYRISREGLAAVRAQLDNR